MIGSDCIIESKLGKILLVNELIDNYGMNFPIVKYIHILRIYGHDVFNFTNV